eukprot:scaffold46606_cov18-Tisochrysis_lutea.AAC.1
MPHPLLVFEIPKNVSLRASWHPVCLRKEAPSLRCAYARVLCVSHFVLLTTREQLGVLKC